MRFHRLSYQSRDPSPLQQDYGKSYLEQILHSNTKKMLERWCGCSQHNKSTYSSFDYHRRKKLLFNS